MTVNLSPESFSNTMTINLSPERRTEAATTVNLSGLSVKATTATGNLGRDSLKGTLRLTVESPMVFPDGTTRYQIRVEERGSEWVVARRFRDFEMLEKQVAPSGIRRASLPGRGLPGLHKLNLGDFQEKRRCGLEAYLGSLSEGIGSLSEMPALAGFCNPGVQAVAPVADSTSAKAVAGAAAVGAVAGLMVPVVGGVVVAAAGAGAAAYATQRSDNVGDVSRKVGSVTADAVGQVVKAVKTAKDRTSNS